MRARLNTEFQNFVKRVEESSGLEFDIPYRELGFYGVPHRSSVLLQPTVHCLVNLTETPFFVLSLDDLEIAYFERVQV
jgi:nucleosome binding factor SPN SPT16 subunit